MVGTRIRGTIWATAIVIAVVIYLFELLMKILAILLCAFITFPVVAQNSNQKTSEDMKTLIVYFSFTAGNTKRIAEKVHAVVGGDLIRLETVKPYPKNYAQAVSQGEDEAKRGYKPELKPLGVELSNYDRIIIGTPTWWYRMSPAVLSFLSNNDFIGKTVIPFMTNAGWPGSVLKDMTVLAEKHGAKVENGHEFRFNSNEKQYDQMETPEEELTEWIDSLK